jgi:hypothetical protein
MKETAEQMHSELLELISTLSDEMGSNNTSTVCGSTHALEGPLIVDSDVPECSSK